MIDRFNVVLDELSAKLGTTDTGQERDEVLAYRRYIDSVKAVEVDTSDFQALRSTATSWLASPEGGQRMAKNVGKFLAIVAGFWLLSRVLGRLAGKAMTLAHGASQILSRFVVNTIRRVTIIVGLLLGLSALEINVTPLVAVIGAAGFVIAALGQAWRIYAAGVIYKNKRLATTGAYSLVRHPLYFGNFLILAGFTLACANWIVVAVVAFFLLFYYPAAIRYEDRKLQELFGDEWQAWGTRTPAMFPTRLQWRANQEAEWDLRQSMLRNGELVYTLFEIAAAVLLWYKATS